MSDELHEGDNCGHGSFVCDECNAAWSKDRRQLTAALSAATARAEKAEDACKAQETQRHQLLRRAEDAEQVLWEFVGAYDVPPTSPTTKLEHLLSAAQVVLAKRRETK